MLSLTISPSNNRRSAHQAVLLGGHPRILAKPPDGPTVGILYDPAEFTTFQGSKYVGEEFVTPWQTDQQGDIVQIAVVAARDAGLDGRLGVYPFCTNGSLTTDLGIPTIGFGPGDPAVAHAIDESVPLEHLTRATRTYFNLARRWAL
jgi:acetylornithine deacetylase/succinyl-diaminopimelate desuccinylase-like protein